MTDLLGQIDTYIEFAEVKDSLFYVKPQLREEGIFQLPPLKTSEWIVKTNKHWTYVMRKEYPFPNQGWKIHITSTLAEAQYLLYEVASFLIKKSISFKFVPSESILAKKNGKYADRSSSGKFITIYPSGEKMFIKLLDELKSIVDKYDQGPYILSDRQWQESNVFFRYGALKDLEKSIDGRILPAIQQTDGTWIEDKREPSYTLPEFVKEPEYVKNHNHFPTIQTEKLDKYHINSVIHYSNGGGVYLGLIGNHKVIIKEARLHAGLGGRRQQDSYHRLRNEYVALSQLDDVKGVVHAHEFFTIWKHAYLAEEFKEGCDLQEFITKHFPFANITARGSIAKAYGHTCIDLLNQIEQIIENIHQRGYAICDLSLSNIIVDEQNHPTIIDLEAAKPLNQPFYPDVSTPGFSTDKASTFEEQDWYAFTSIAYTMLLPTSPIEGLAPSIMIRKEMLAESHLGRKAGQYLSSLRDRMSVKAPIYSPGPFTNKNLSIPRQWLDDSTAGSVRQALCKGLFDNPNSIEIPLVAGDPNKCRYPLGEFNIATGAFGMMLALSRAHIDSFIIAKQRYGKWFDDSFAHLTANTTNTTQDWGLFTGLFGIVTASYEMGWRTEAKALLSLTNPEQLLENDNRDISIYSGLSGIGLALLALPNDMIEQRCTLLKKISDRVMDLAQKVGHGNEYTDRGLLTGWLGAALFLWKYGIITANFNIKRTARQLLKDSYPYLSEQEHMGDPIYLIDCTRNEPRSLPYLENGSAGIALTMLEMSKDEPDLLEQKESALLTGLIASGDMACAYNGGLFSGYAGFLPLSTAARAMKRNQRMQSRIIKGLNAYLLEQGNGRILFPGAYGYKCSMDYSTGAAGVLLALTDINQSRWNSWFPVPLDTDLNLFSISPTRQLIQFKKE